MIETLDPSSRCRTPPFVHAKIGEWFSISSVPSFMVTSSLGKCTGWEHPYWSRVRVSSGMGTGNDSATRDLQNKPKNIFFGGELNEI